MTAEVTVLAQESRECLATISCLSATSEPCPKHHLGVTQKAQSFGSIDGTDIVLCM